MNDALHGREAWRPQGSAIVVVGERWGIHGPGEATLTSSILVRIRVPQPGSRPQIAAYL